MEVKALSKNAPISPSKARLVGDQIRGLPVERALALLAVSPKKAARLFEKILKSAIANAEQNNGLDIDTLFISSVQADAGMTLKRFRPTGRGRMRKRKKRYAHIVVGVRAAE
ncbi:MAG: 50S ribosomal protein L22 [Mariprofundales bacterium]